MRTYGVFYICDGCETLVGLAYDFYSASAYVNMWSPKSDDEKLVMRELSYLDIGNSPLKMAKVFRHNNEDWAPNYAEEMEDIKHRPKYLRSYGGYNPCRGDE